MKKYASLCICFLVAVASFMIVSGDSEGDEEWSYDDTHWKKTCTTGKRQSPINIDLANVVITHNGPIEFHNYDTKSHIVASNTGRTELVEGFQDWSEKPYITGGGLPGKYYLSQFHFHWGDVDTTGSEHTLNQLHYPLEVHFVHFLEGHNETTARSTEGGIVSVSVMLQVDKKEDVLQSLEDAIMETNNTNRTAELQRYSPSVLIPKDTTTFFRYEGSQTTPPCTEGKIWIILAEPKHVKEEELEFLRQHVTAEGKHEGHTFRETQPLNGRIVFFNRKLPFQNEEL